MNWVSGRSRPLCFFLYCGLQEECFLGRTGFLVAVPGVAKSQHCLIASPASSFCNTSIEKNESVLKKLLSENSFVGALKLVDVQVFRWFINQKHYQSFHPSG